MLMNKLFPRGTKCISIYDVLKPINEMIIFQVFPPQSTTLASLNGIFYWMVSRALVRHHTQGPGLPERR